MHVFAFLCLYCMQINKPVFLKGKSSLLSMGDGRVYWQVGDVPPRGGELWSSDVWWEDLLKRRQYDEIDHISMLNTVSAYITLTQDKTTENTYVYQSFGWWIKEWLTPLPAGSFADLLNRNSWSFCFTSVLATAPVRPKDGTKGIGVTLGLWLMTYYCLKNIPNQTWTQW